MNNFSNSFLTTLAEAESVPVDVTLDGNTIDELEAPVALALNKPTELFELGLDGDWTPIFSRTSVVNLYTALFSLRTHKTNTTATTAIATKINLFVIIRLFKTLIIFSPLFRWLFISFDLFVMFLI